LIRKFAVCTDHPAIRRAIDALELELSSEGDPPELVTAFFGREPHESRPEGRALREHIRRHGFPARNNIEDAVNLVQARYGVELALHDATSLTGNLSLEPARDVDGASFTLTHAHDGTVIGRYPSRRPPASAHAFPTTSEHALVMAIGIEST